MGLLSVLGAVAGYALAPATGGASLALAGAALGSSIGGSLEASQAAKANTSAASKAASAQSNAANYAADLQRQTAQDQIALQKQMYQEGVTRQEPWYQAGKSALSTLQTGLAPGGQFTQKFTPNDLTLDPGYKWRLQQGQRALEQSAAAKGIQFSGGTQAALQDYGQNAASQEYANAYNRFQNQQTLDYNRQASLAGIGQTVGAGLANSGSNLANQVGNVQTNMANQVGNYGTQAANAQAAGIMANYNNQQNAFGQLAGAFGQAGQSGLFNSIGTPSSNPYGWGGSFNQSNSVNLSDGSTFAV